jgi:hypothetical protein
MSASFSTSSFSTSSSSSSSYFPFSSSSSSSSSSLSPTLPPPCHSIHTQVLLNQTDTCAGLLKFKKITQTTNEHNNKNDKNVDKNTNSWNFIAYSTGVIDIGIKPTSKITSKKEKEGDICKVANQTEKELESLRIRPILEEQLLWLKNNMLR